MTVQHPEFCTCRQCTYSPPREGALFWAGVAAIGLTICVGAYAYLAAILYLLGLR